MRIERARSAGDEFRVSWKRLSLRRRLGHKDQPMMALPSAIFRFDQPSLLERPKKGGSLGHLARQISAGERTGVQQPQQLGRGIGPAVVETKLASRVVA